MTVDFAHIPSFILNVLRVMDSITVEIGQHFPIHKINRLLKERIFQKNKIRAYITMTSQLQLQKLVNYSLYYGILNNIYYLKETRRKLA